MTEVEQLVTLNAVGGLSSQRMRRLLDAFGSPERIWSAPHAALRQVEGISEALAARIVAARADVRSTRTELAAAAAAGAQIVTCRDADYPEPLRLIPDPPVVLYRKGTWYAEDRAAVAVVGSRHASLYGRQQAERLGYELAGRGITVVSGLARGIDVAAHRGALRAGGRTVAVIGSGLDRLYPPEHAELAEEIARRGAVLTEYPMTMDALPHNFPRRNRLISGLALGVVVVEASARSGALITADCALEQGREVFAVPGRIDHPGTQGTHGLLKQGAQLVAGVEDILETLQLELTRLIAPRRPPEADAAIRASDPNQARVLGCLRGGQPVDLEQIVTQSGLPMAACTAMLLQLELRRAVRQLPGKRFVSNE